jgi:hypothetical protein
VLRSMTGVRGTVCAVAAVALIAVLLTARGKSVDARNALAIPLALWWLSPLAYYWWRVTTVSGAWIVGAGFIGAGAWFLISIYRDEGSTAAVSFLFVPLLLWPGMVIVVEAERAMTR